MTFVPRLSFTKYVSRMDVAFLTDYLERLAGLHPDYQGLVLPGATQPKPADEAAKELLALLDKETDARKMFKGFVCRHRVGTRASCGDFSWDITFERFEISGDAFNGLVGYPLQGEPDFVRAYGNEEALLATQAPQWIEQGICNTVSDLGSLFSLMSDAWGVYLDSKDAYKYDARSNYNNSPFDYWGEYPEDRREQIAEMLDVLRPHVASCHPELFTGDAYGANTEADHRTFVRYADDRLLRHFGEQGLNALLSVVDISLEQWLSAGEPKPANYSIGGILLPS